MSEDNGDEYNVGIGWRLLMHIWEEKQVIDGKKTDISVQHLTPAIPSPKSAILL